MGWVGGGVGKSSGIEAPVAVNPVVSRRGFGSLSADHFSGCLTRLFESYLHSQQRQDLIFSSELTRDEQAAVTAQARKHKLVVRSVKTRGSGQFVVVSLRRTMRQLVQYLMSCADETALYLLQHPTASLT